MFCPNRLACVKMALAIALIGPLSIGGSASGDVADITVSQKGRKFDPLSVDLATGGALMIVNDDGDLLHHAYVESETFSFDSGDQKPGSRTRVVFSVAGDFKVLCGIHPKMKLLVHVQ